VNGRDRRLAAVGGALVLPVLAFLALGASNTQMAAAHPLGNFTVNRYSRVELYSDAVRVRYILDMAEIPTFQELNEIDTNGDGDQSLPESDAYAAARGEALLENIRLTLNGSPADLRVLTRGISYPAGQAGLKTLRLSLMLEAPLPASVTRLDYSDTNYSDRIGWKEVVLQPAAGVTVVSSSIPTTDTSRELTEYPEDLLSSPLNITAAAVSFDATGGGSAPIVAASIAAPDRAPSRAGGGFASLVDTTNLTLTVLLVSLLAAFGFGALHALEPGHGKTLVAAYFVGVKGTATQAMGLGLIIAVTHTVGVLAIGSVALFGSQWILPERLYPWLSLASGLLVLSLGLRLILARAGGVAYWRRFSSAIHGHSHDHGHSGHHHSHEPSTEGPPPWRSLIALGLADGLTPSPSALIVLLAALSLDRIGLGLALIVAFSVGLATVLTLVCLGLVYARRFVDWVSESKAALAHNRGVAWFAGRLSPEAGLMRTAPVFGACALTVVGLVLTLRALAEPSLPLF